MIPKQEERIRKKIKSIKRDLVADKRRHHGYYDDSGGLRYLPPELYLKLGDYTEALRYFNWFRKNFPDDIGYPPFLIEWSITLFKTKRLKQAEKKVMETFAANTYLIEFFLGKEVMDQERFESSNWQSKELLESFGYSKDDEALRDFAEWLENLIVGPEFSDFADTIMELNRKLKSEPVGHKRTERVKERYKLISEIDM